MNRDGMRKPKEIKDATDLVRDAIHETRLKPQKCPNPICGYIMDACTPAPGGEIVPPKGGDYTFCMKCQTLLVFNIDLSFREATEDDLRKEPPEFLVYLANMRSGINAAMAQIKAERN